MLFDNIKDLSRQMKFHTLPKLNRWYAILSEANDMYNSGVLYCNGGFGIISPVDVEYRANVLNLLIGRLNDVIISRSTILLGEKALA